MLTHYFLQKGQAVHARHFDIKGDNVRHHRFQPFRRQEGISRGGHHLDAGIGVENVAQGLPHQGRIINNQHLDLLHALTPDAREDLGPIRLT